MSSVLLYLIVAFLVTVNAGADTDVDDDGGKQLGAQLLELEKEVLRMKVKSAEQDAKHFEQGLEIAQQQIAIADQNTKIALQDNKIAQLEISRNVLMTQIDNLKTPEEDFIDRSHTGPVLIRWGRKDCPINTTDLIYSGRAGGSSHLVTGASAAYLCLPMDPTWGRHKNKNVGSDSTELMGSEYQTKILYGFDYKQKVPCAMCEAKSHFSQKMMIPGRVNCYPGWTVAYFGTLSSGKSDHKAASSFACMDDNPESFNWRTDTSDNGKLFYAVKTKCGSLPCPPYEDNKVVSCVVCLK